MPEVEYKASTQQRGPFDGGEELCGGLTAGLHVADHGLGCLPVGEREGIDLGERHAPDVRGFLWHRFATSSNDRFDPPNDLVRASARLGSVAHLAVGWRPTGPPSNAFDWRWTPLERMNSGW
jgi:hypothetical protein